MPDIVANVRLDQDWGKLMLSGVVHEVRYPVSTDLIPEYDTGDDIDADYGYAVALSGAFNLPFLPGSYIVLEGTYAHGAGAFLGGADDEFQGGTAVGLTSVPDAVFNPITGDSELTTGWAIAGELGVELTPALKLLAFGSYLNVDDTDVDDDDDTDPEIFDNNFLGGRSAWIAGANATYTLAPGLTVAAEVSYQSVDFDDQDDADNVFFSDDDDDNDSQWAGGVRIKRIF